MSVPSITVATASGGGDGAGGGFRALGSTADRASAGAPHAEFVARFAIVKFPASARLTIGAPDAFTVVANAMPALGDSPSFRSVPTSIVAMLKASMVIVLVNVCANVAS